MTTERVRYNRPCAKLNWRRGCRCCLGITQRPRLKRAASRMRRRADKREDRAELAMAALLMADEEVT